MASSSSGSSSNSAAPATAVASPPLVWVKNRLGGSSSSSSGQQSVEHPAYLLEEVESSSSSQRQQPGEDNSTVSSSERRNAVDDEEQQSQSRSQNHRRCLVRWATSGRIEWIDGRLVVGPSSDGSLPPRRARGRRRSVADADDDGSRSPAAAGEEPQPQTAAKRGPTTRSPPPTERSHRRRPRTAKEGSGSCSSGSSPSSSPPPANGASSARSDRCDDDDEEAADGSSNSGSSNRDCDEDEDYDNHDDEDDEDDQNSDSSSDVEVLCVVRRPEVALAAPVAAPPPPPPPPAPRINHNHRTNNNNVHNHDDDEIIELLDDDDDDDEEDDDIPLIALASRAATATITATARARARARRRVTNVHSLPAGSAGAGASETTAIRKPPSVKRRPFPDDDGEEGLFQQKSDGDDNITGTDSNSQKPKAARVSIHQQQQPAQNDATSASTTGSTTVRESTTTTNEHRLSAVPSSEEAPLVTTAAAAGASSSSAEDTESSSALQRPSNRHKRNGNYSFVSSAYLQTLAEICHTVLQDRRWTVGVGGGGSSNTNRMQPLFQWEHGDDLSAVRVLSRRYLKANACSSRQQQRTANVCKCLLCRDEKQAGQSVSSLVDKEEMAHGEHAAKSIITRSGASGNGSFATGSIAEDSPSEDDEEEEEDRNLYLYGRLVYRKGPWFRLDDVYSRYYAPPNKEEAEEATANAHETVAVNAGGGRHQQEGQVHHQATTTTATTNIAAGAVSKKENTPPRPSKTDFFQPNNKRRKANQEQSVRGSSRLDENLVEEHLECVANLMSDVDRLRSKGLLRSFLDEEECGRTVGVGLLTSTDRNAVLSKLGTKHQKNAPGHSSSSSTSSQPRANEIWIQMTSQTTLFRTSKVLPVIRHVDEILLERLAKSIALSCTRNGRTDYIPAAELRQHIRSIKSRILATASRLFQGTTSSGTPPTCFRLREGPTLTLQRCVRLYLCATSGPGEMRGDGTNGWRSLKDIGSPNLPLSSQVPPPDVHTFNQVAYPPLTHCFGLRSACFVESYQHFPVSEKDVSSDRLIQEQVFTSRESFLAWEVCVELRSNVDYLLELNDMLRYNERRRKRGVEALGGNAAGEASNEHDSVDFLQLLTPQGRGKVLAGLSDAFSCAAKEEIETSIRRELDLSLNAVNTECEKIMIVIAVLSITVLCKRNQEIDETECALMSKRPWLRHLWWDGCLTYILWDMIPVLERCGLYRIAILALETLLRGSAPCRLADPDSSFFPATASPPTKLAPLLLSRRARGKAYDRLVIDLSHLHRKENTAADLKESQRKQLQKTHTSRLVSFCKATIDTVVGSGYISFSSIRTLARRLKRPLSATLQGAYCLEARELGLRLENDTAEYGDCSQQQVKQESKQRTAQQQKYTDWEAITDRFVANAVTNDSSDGPGSRCSFIGFEEQGQKTGSLNVEQLAMELYNTGRLPASATAADVVAPGESKGGWVGWHDEGGHVRALFRILCSAPILGMDWGCGRDFSIDSDPTVHLSPYQGAPFDLHVGFHSQQSSATGSTEDRPSENAGFYVRRRGRIEAFLTKLVTLDGQELCDVVYDSISARLQYMIKNERKDPSLEGDVRQVRTLSLIAAGCGGKQLASIFRCLFFDYRHFSGGLPDLLMVRATFDGAGAVLVDASEWVGEGFAREHREAQDAQRACAMLSDRDDEFLGCSKVGDSGGGTGRSNRAQRGGGQQSGARVTTLVDDCLLPDKLVLVHDGRPVQVECMMVEVKSSNDRLDPRQEDWLNILDRHGNARVCKFEDTRKKKKQQGGDGKNNNSTDSKPQAQQKEVERDPAIASALG